MYSSPKLGKYKAEIQRYDTASRRWITIYSKVIDGIGSSPFYVLKGQDVINQNVVVLWTTSTGSGSTVNYTVIGERNGSILAYAERKGIFQGDVWFE